MKHATCLQNAGEVFFLQGRNFFKNMIYIILWFERVRIQRRCDIQWDGEMIGS